MSVLSEVITTTATGTNIGAGSDFKPVGTMTGMTLIAIVLCVAVVAVLVSAIVIKIKWKKK